MYAGKTRIEKFSGPGENYLGNVTNLVDNEFQAADRTSNAGVAVLAYTVDVQYTLQLSASMPGLIPCKKAAVLTQARVEDRGRADRITRHAARLAALGRN